MPASMRGAKNLNLYYAEFGIDPSAPVPVTNRTPFNSEMCAVVEELKPEVVSFHYGLPDDSLVKRVKASGCKGDRFRDNGYRGSALGEGRL